MAEEKKIKRTTVEREIERGGYFSIHFYPNELKQFVAKGVFKNDFQVPDVYKLVCEKFGVIVHTRGTGSAVKTLKEKYDMSPSVMAKKVLADPEVMKRLGIVPIAVNKKK